jgi:hypothetical protein
MDSAAAPNAIAMSRLGVDEAPEMPHSADQGPAKKKKPLACRRCRQRKQKAGH